MKKSDLSKLERGAASKRKERANKKASGLKRFETWIPPILETKIKKYIDDLVNSWKKDKDKLDID